MTAPSRALVAIPSAPVVRRPRRKPAPIVARVHLLDPRKLAALRTAQELGASLAVSFDGYTLTITAAPHANARGAA